MECERFALQERPPVPYMPEKDPVQETVSALKSDQSLKTTIREDAELHLLIWHCGAHEAFLMNVSMAIDGIEKRGTFKAHKEACEVYVEQHEAAKQAKAALAILNATMSKGEKTSKKASEKASQKTKEGTALADAPNLEPHSIRLTTRKPNPPQRPPRTSAKPLLPRWFSSMRTYCLWMPSSRGTRFSRSRWRLIHSRIFKACPGKARGDFRVSNSTTASCYTFSPCFQTMRLRKKSTTFPTCSRSPSRLAYISLYSM
jgi:hypothetical protein